MIRRTLQATKEATFCVQLPDPAKYGMPTPAGTGFFVSPDGWFVTAAHVVSENGEPSGPLRSDIEKAWLVKETRLGSDIPGAMYQGVSLGPVIPELDIAFLHVDFSINANKAWLSGRTSFPFVQISAKVLEEGESIYSFGYPLSIASVIVTPERVVGEVALSPRVTSAIISSTLNETTKVMSDTDPKVYVLDKALNYGNSGGPIVSSETGHVHALCSRFQPVFVPQLHLKDQKGNPLHVMMPSLYGIVSRLDNRKCLKVCGDLNIPVSYK